MLKEAMVLLAQAPTTAISGRLENLLLCIDTLLDKEEQNDVAYCVRVVNSYAALRTNLTRVYHTLMQAGKEKGASVPDLLRGVSAELEWATPTPEESSEAQNLVRSLLYLRDELAVLLKNRDAELVEFYGILHRCLSWTVLSMWYVRMLRWEVT